jgi:hypothetical protein
MGKQEEFEDTKGVIRGSTPKKDIQKEIEDTKGVVRKNTPKKDMQAELEDKKRSNQGPNTEEGHIKRD